MNPKVHNQTVSYIWSIADDVLRDVFVRGKYRDIILPFTVIRRLDILLVPTKDEVLQTYEFLLKEKIDDRSALKTSSGYAFYNTSKFTLDSLLNTPDDIDTNLEAYLDGFSPNVQEIISKFKLRNQLETMREAGITYALIEKLCNKDINLSTNQSKNTKGEPLPPLTNLGMGYVFEELIRKFNEENNEEAGEHFTPREIIQLMTHILFLPVKDKLGKDLKLIYDPACGSGGMLTEAEHYALEITNNKGNFQLYGQEVNPETYAICTSDMLIKDEQTENIKYGSTLANDGFGHLKFDFMLSNPPYGKTWKIDADAIVDDRGKKGKEKIKDNRFQVGLPTISDGQLLFLLNMVSKMKHDFKKSLLGSRIATIHNGSALFTGDAGGGESEIRKHIIENDWLECIIALPKNIFYNTGIPTYVWIVSNKKAPHRKGKVQLINAIDLYTKLRKNLGQKNCELTAQHIDQITQLYIDFKETEISKIYPNNHFGYHKITVERPLRLSTQFTNEAIETLRFDKNLLEPMQWAYSQFSEDIYTHIDKYTPQLQNYLKTQQISLKASHKKDLLSQSHWQYHLELVNAAKQLAGILGTQPYYDYNTFVPTLNKAIKKLGITIDKAGLKTLLNAISYKNEDAQPIIKKKEKDGTIHYEPDTDLRDTENIPLAQDIQQYFEREVLAHVPDAWIDHSKTTVGYEISFTRYFYNYVPPRSLQEITDEILQLENETEGILNQIVNG